MSWDPADDFDDAGRYRPGPGLWPSHGYRPGFRERATWQCSERCCPAHSRLCDPPEPHDEEGDDSND